MAKAQALLHDLKLGTHDNGAIKTYPKLYVTGTPYNRADNLSPTIQYINPTQFVVLPMNQASLTPAQLEEFPVNFPGYPEATEAAAATAEAVHLSTGHNGQPDDGETVKKKGKSDV